MLTPSQVTEVVATATAAPSVQNSQPWLFTVDDSHLCVFADRTRELRRQDPHGRELLISCGAASLHAELAVRSLGLSGDVSLLPDGHDLIARIGLDAGAPATEEELRLHAAIPHRHTDRNPFADWPVPGHVLERLGAAAEEEGAWLQVLTTADMLELSLLQAHAQAALLDDPGALAERGRWARQNDRPDDGLPEQWVPGWSARNSARPSVRPLPSAVPDVVLVLGTEDDDPLSWVRAGRALARVLLEATCDGLVAAPATLALELPAVRDVLTNALSLHGSPQMVLRTGYPAGLSTPPTGRRGVEDVLVSSDLLTE